MVSVIRTNELAEALWTKAGKPDGGAELFHAEAEQRLKAASLAANYNLTTADGHNQRDMAIHLSQTSPGEQPFRPR